MIQRFPNLTDIEMTLMKKMTKKILRGVMIVDLLGWQENKRRRKIGRLSWKRLGEVHRWIRWRWMVWMMKNLICHSLIKGTPGIVQIRSCGMMWILAWRLLERPWKKKRRK
jgi:hypothetical protein